MERKPCRETLTPGSPCTDPRHAQRNDRPELVAEPGAPTVAQRKRLRFRLRVMSCIDHLISEGWFRASPHPPWPSENYELVGSRDRAFNPRHVPGAARVRHGVPADATGNRIARSLAVPTGGGAVCFGRVGDPRAKVDVRRHFHPRPATRLPFWPRSTSPRRPLQLEFPRSLPSASTRCDGRYLIGSVERILFVASTGFPGSGAWQGTIARSRPRA